MIIYNTTYHVDCTVSGEFIDWMRSTFVPRAVASGIVCCPRLMRLMGHNEGGVCIAMQLQAPTLRDLQQWNVKVGKPLHDELTQRFGNKVAGFTTFMENIEL